jgi:hypothetical protein
MLAREVAAASKRRSENSSSSYAGFDASATTVMSGCDWIVKVNRIPHQQMIVDGQNRDGCAGSHSLPRELSI